LLAVLEPFSTVFNSRQTLHSSDLSVCFVFHYCTAFLPPPDIRGRPPRFNVIDNATAIICSPSWYSTDKRCSRIIRCSVLTWSWFGRCRGIVVIVDGGRVVWFVVVLNTVLLLMSQCAY